MFWSSSKPKKPSEGGGSTVKRTATPTHGAGGSLSSPLLPTTSPSTPVTSPKAAEVTGRRSGASGSFFLLCLSHAIVICVCFIVGTRFGSQFGDEACQHLEALASFHEDAMMQQNGEMPPSSGRNENVAKWRIPTGLSAMFAGSARVTRQDFLREFDTGIPAGPDEPGNEEVLLLYDAPATLPENYDNYTQMPLFDDPIKATANCQVMLVLHVDANSEEPVCMAFQGQATEPHYHIHRWIQEDDPETPGKKRYKAVGRYHTGDAELESKMAEPPKPVAVQEANRLLQHYLSIYQKVSETLKPVAQKAADSFSSSSSKHKNTVVVMVCSSHQVEMLVNFACNAQALGISLDKYLLFAMDEKTRDIAKSIGFTNTFYQAQLFEKILVPGDGSTEYGTLGYARMIMCKNYVVHLVSLLGFNLVFQDLDVLPFRKDYLDFFLTTLVGETYPNRDMYFQYEAGTRQLEYAPWFANSGFYYAANNERTRYLFSYLLRHGDVILRSRSHQATLAMVLSDVANQYGLHVKVLEKETEQLPVGYHFHKEREYMMAMMKDEFKPYVFHMNWNENQDRKKEFFQQIGSWYVDDLWSADEQQGPVIKEDVCRAEPKPACFYRDKPSRLEECKTYPAVEEGTSFW